MCELSNVIVWGVVIMIILDIGIVWVNVNWVLLVLGGKFINK